jgi:hypothetical protein
MARVMESSGQSTCSELWRWKGYPLEGKLEGRLGMYQRHEQLNACLQGFFITFFLLNTNFLFN